MKTSKLLVKLGALVETADDLDKQHLKKLCKVIRALKEKQKKIENELKQEADEAKRARLQRSIEVIRSQRKKGCESYAAMKQARAAAKAP